MQAIFESPTCLMKRYFTLISKEKRMLINNINTAITSHFGQVYYRTEKGNWFGLPHHGKPTEAVNLKEVLNMTRSHSTDAAQQINGVAFTAEGLPSVLLTGKHAIQLRDMQAEQQEAQKQLVLGWLQAAGVRF
jgi:hypothetical protein